MKHHLKIYYFLHKYYPNIHNHLIVLKTYSIHPNIPNIQYLLYNRQLSIRIIYSHYFKYCFYHLYILLFIYFHIYHLHFYYILFDKFNIYFLFHYMHNNNFIKVVSIHMYLCLPNCYFYHIERHIQFRKYHIN